MPGRIKISAGNIIAEGELNNSPTAKAIWEALPLESSVNTWGDEIYFEIPVTRSLDDTAKELVSMGDLGYWPPGKAFCIFFGPTPISQGDEIRPYSAVNIVGRVLNNPEVFKQVPPGTKVRIEPLST
jgi:hypothetical protein